MTVDGMKIEEGNVEIKTRGSNWKYVSFFFITLSVALVAYTIYDHANHAPSQPDVGSTTPRPTTEATKPVNSSTTSVDTSTTSVDTTTIPVDTSTTSLATPTTVAYTPTICLTTTCITAASQIIMSMNTSVDPCDNFYDYACGHWGAQHPVRLGAKSNEMFSVIIKSVERKIKYLLKSPVIEQDSKAVVNTKNCYQSCMDTETINTLAAAPIQEYLSEYGDWPIAMAESWDESKFDLYKVLSTQMINSVNSLSNVRIIYNNKKKGPRYQLGLMHPVPVTTSNFYTDVEFLGVYKQLIKGVAVIINKVKTNVNYDEIDKQAQEIVDFERAIVEDLLQDYHYKEIMTYGELSELSETFPFDTVIKASFEHFGLKLENDTMVTSYLSKGYFRNLTSLLERTDSRIIANYVIWRDVYDALTFDTPAIFSDVMTEYTSWMYYEKSYKYRHNYCTDKVNRVFKWPIGRMFVDKYFDESAKTTALDMVGELKEAFKEMLDKVDWMDETSIDAAKEKVDAIKQRIGYPEYIKDDKTLDAMFEDVHTTAGNFFKNMQSISQHSVKKSMQLLDKNYHHDAWSLPPSTVNAMYIPSRNEIVFPAGILQIPFYHKSYPKYLNFAGIGFVIGHEITHGFDNNGRKWDKDGKYETWWSKEVSRKYLQRAKCYVEQYNNFTVKSVGLHVRGDISLNENLADNGAVKESFLAYRNYVQKERAGVEEPMLPGFENFTQNQLFFLNVAQPWCGVVDNPDYWKRALKAVHAPGRFRILGSMANSDDFAKAFNCKVGSKMNPRHKCKLW